MEITALWDEMVPIEEYTTRDFAHRDSSLSVYDETDGRLFSALDVLTDKWDCTQSAALDRSIRLFTAHVLDTVGQSHQRDEHNTAVTIPPTGWLSANHDCRFDVSIEPTEQRGKVNANTVAVVKELLQWTCTHHTDFETEAAYNRHAVLWMCGEDMDDHFQM